MTAKVMEESSLEEKRCMIFGSEAESQTRDARPATARKKPDARLNTMQEETKEIYRRNYKNSQMEDMPEDGAEEEFVDSDFDAKKKTEVLLNFKFGRQKNTTEKSEEEIQKNQEDSEGF